MQDKGRMMSDIHKLVTYIVCYATEREERLTILRLVKFLYLADLFMARESGKTLTGWPWSFVYFGPYCSEAISVINETARLGLIDTEKKESQYSEEDYSIYWCDHEIPEEIEEALPIYVTSKLKAAIKKWGGDSSGLLDFVYFETEPMLNAKKGQPLDFSLAHKPEKLPEIEMKKMSKSQLKKGKEALQILTSKVISPLTEISDDDIKIDKEFDRWIRSLDGEDLTPGLKGQAKIET